MVVIRGDGETICNGTDTFFSLHCVPITNPFEFYSSQSPFKTFHHVMFMYAPVVPVDKIPFGGTGLRRLAEDVNVESQNGELGPTLKPRRPHSVAPLTHILLNHQVKVRLFPSAACLCCGFPILHQCHFRSLRLFIRPLFRIWVGLPPTHMYSTNAHTHTRERSHKASCLPRC